MTHDISKSILAHISNFAVGLVVRKDGAGNEVLGSGVLVSIEGRRGILTCGHVAAHMRNFPKSACCVSSPGTRKTRKGGTSTKRYANYNPRKQRFVRGEQGGFRPRIHSTPPDAASPIEAHGGVFLNIEKNRAKMNLRHLPKGSTLMRSSGLSRSSRNSPSLEERN